MNIRRLPIPELVELAITGNRRALGRTLTLVESGGDAADAVADLVHPRAGRAHVVGPTGAPGSGKSTLTGRLLAEATAAGATPAVVAVDPSSPLTGGAILGDRIRMDDAAPGSFIRSMATRGHAGGLALAVPGAVRVLDAAGFDPIVIETVGVGQVEVDVAAAADTTVVVVTPGWGDAVQANKAGLLEVADVFVVNKADRPGAGDARRDLELMLDLSHLTGQDQRDADGVAVEGRRPEILLTTATDGTGAADLWAAVVAHRRHLADAGRLPTRRAHRLRQEVRARIDQLLAAEVSAALGSPEGLDLLDAAAARSISPTVVARTVVTRLVGPDHAGARPSVPPEVTGG